MDNEQRLVRFVAYVYGQLRDIAQEDLTRVERNILNELRRLDTDVGLPFPVASA